MNFHKFALSAGLLMAACCLRLPGSAQNVRPSQMVANEVLVGLRPTLNGTVKTTQAIGTMGEIAKAHPSLFSYRIHLHPGVSVEAAIAQLKKNPNVLYAEPNRIVHSYATPNDSLFAQQYAPQLVQADFAWDIWRPQTSVTIAVIDTGVDNAHPDLADSILRDVNGNVIGYNAITRQTGAALDDNGHGTHCTGIAAAQINNGAGIAGIAGWDGDIGSPSSSAIKVMPIKALGSDGTGTDDDIAAGITWAADHGARVISMSLGRTGPSSNTLNNAVQYAWNRGCVLVAAAGNDGSSAVNYPAGIENVISVAATDANDRLTASSNWGPWVRVAAPGQGILSTMPGYDVVMNGQGAAHDYDTLSGTSTAAPLIAGEAAMLLSENPHLTPAQISDIIIANGDAYTPLTGKSLASGAGRANVYSALQIASVQNLPAVPFDFNNDGQSDLLWQNQTTGDVTFWVMNNGQWTGEWSYVSQGNTSNWKIMAAPDLDGDGQSDLVWQNTTNGDVSYWIMNNGAWTGEWGYIARAVPSAWKLVTAAHLFGDSSINLVWQNTTTGDVSYMEMSGTQWTGNWISIAANVSAAWKIAGSSDLDNDGQSDLIWQNTTTGEVTYWQMSNGHWTGNWGYIARNIPGGWQITGLLDCTGDGQSDLIWQNTTTGDVSYMEMSGTQWTGAWAYIAHGVPTNWKIVGTH